MTERFYVVEIEGQGIDPRPTWRLASRSYRRWSTSFSILDSADCHREVWRDYTDARGIVERRRRIYRKCAMLNARVASGAASGLDG